MNPSKEAIAAARNAWHGDARELWGHLSVKLERALTAAYAIDLVRSVQKELEYCVKSHQRQNKVVADLETELEDVEKTVDSLQQQLSAAQAELEKEQLCASVLCSAHRGVPQKKCPICKIQFAELQLDAAQADLARVKEVEFPERIDKVIFAIRAERDQLQVEVEDAVFLLGESTKFVPGETGLYTRINAVLARVKEKGL